MTDETTDRPADEPLPPITGSGRATLSALSTISARGYVTRKVLIWSGVAASVFASMVTAALTALLDDGWLGFGAGVLVSGGVTALVAWKVATQKMEHVP